MEKLRILNWRDWSRTKKSAAVGATVGASVTLAMPVVLTMYSDAYGAGPASLFLLGLGALVLWPAAETCKFFGWTWKIEMSRTLFPSFAQMIIALAVNAFLVSVAFTFVSWLLKRWKRI